MIQLETERLVLRNYELNDINDFYEYMKLEYTALHDDFDPLTYEESVDLLQRRVNKDNYLVVELKNDNKVIGDVSFDLEEFNTYIISYDFNVSYEKNGYATEACKALVEYIFSSLGGRRVYAECNEENIKSIKLLERLNFRKEAHFIEDVAFKKNSDGKLIFVNSYVYAILKKEWVNNSIV